MEKSDAVKLNAEKAKQPNTEPSKKKAPEDEPDSQATEYDDFPHEANQALSDEEKEKVAPKKDVPTVNTIPLRFLHHENSMNLETDEDEDELNLEDEEESEEENVTSTNKKLPLTLFSW